MLISRIALIAVTVFVPLAAKAESVIVVRPVPADSSGVALTDPSQFRFDPGLSTFDAQGAPVAPCYVGFTITGVPNNPPKPNDAGVVADLRNGDASYTAVFDNKPAGTWNIELPAGVLGAEGSQDVSAYARGDRTRIIFGTSDNCAPN